MVLAGTDRHGETVELHCTKTEFLSAQFIQNAHTCSNSQWSRGTDQLAAVETFSASSYFAYGYVLNVSLLHTHTHTHTHTRAVTKVHGTDMSDIRLSPLCKWDLGSYGMLHSVNWYLQTFRVNLMVPTSRVMPFWLLKMGPIGCPETPVTIYQSIPRNIPEERSSNAEILTYSTSLFLVYFLKVNIIRKSIRNKFDVQVTMHHDKFLQ